MSKNSKVSVSCPSTITPEMLTELNKLRAENAALKAKASGEKVLKPLSLEAHVSGGTIIKGGCLSWKGIFVYPGQLAFLKANMAEIEAFAASVKPATTEPKTDTNAKCV